MKLFVATKALIVHEGKVLLLQESSKYEEGANAGKWDVPGGRVKPGQAFEESLRREIIEETGLTEINIIKPIHVGEWRPVVKGEQWQIIGIYFLCTTPTTNITLSQDHQAYQWINPKEINLTLCDSVGDAINALDT